MSDEQKNPDVPEIPADLDINKAAEALGEDPADLAAEVLAKMQNPLASPPSALFGTDPAFGDIPNLPESPQTPAKGGTSDEGGQGGISTRVDDPRGSEAPLRASGGGRKVCIVGSAPGWETAPFDPKEGWEIWSLSRMYTQIPRWDRWFELHRYEDLCARLDGSTPPEAVESARREYHQWLAQDHGRPIIMQEIRPEVPNSVRFPIEAVREQFPHQYFTNSIGYMIALAILEGDISRLDIYGVDMSTEEEYREQRPGVEYWIGFAAGYGMDVRVPPVGELLKTRTQYAYDSPDGTHAKMQYRLDAAKRAEKHAQNVKREAEIREAHAAGSREILEWMIGNFS